MKDIIGKLWRKVLNGISYVKYLWIHYTHRTILIEIDPITPWLKANEALRSKDILVLDYIWIVGFPTRENRKPGADLEASKSEVKRWCQANKVWMNGRPVRWDEKVQWPVTRCVLFPGTKTQTSFI